MKTTTALTKETAMKRTTTVGNKDNVTGGSSSFPTFTLDSCTYTEIGTRRF
jgi:hypothetical protein